MAGTAYVVCTTPRSGSGLLCEALWSTGVAGKPDEYFFEGTDAQYTKSWGTTDTTSYLACVREFGTTPNGVFGFKIMREHLARFEEQFAATHAGSGADRGALENVFPGLRYIWLTRSDKVRQAVSLWKRLETGVHHWCEEEPMAYARRPEFDFQAIHNLVRKFEAWDACWQDYFVRHGLSPLEVGYEDHIERSCEAAVLKVLAFLGVPIPEPLALHTRRKKQSDALSEEFVRRYERCSGTSTLCSARDD